MARISTNAAASSRKRLPTCSITAVKWSGARPLTLGSFQIRLVRSGHYWWDGGVMFGIVPRTLWSKRIPPDKENRIPLAFNSYLVETGDHHVLIDTGGGSDFTETQRTRMELPATVPSTADALRAESIDPERIDIVINTHLHWDHCSGNMANGKPAFPNARYYTQRGEWNYAHSRNPRDSTSYIDVNYDPLVEAGCMELVDGGREIVPGISVEVAPGHNRDMMVVRAGSGGQTFCMLADLVPTAEHLKPTWATAFDLFPLTTAETRIRLLSQAAREGWWCGFAHEMKVAFATVTEDFKINATL